MYKKINYYFCIFYVLLSIAVGIYNIYYSTAYYIFLSFVAPIFLLIPSACNRVFRLNPVHPLNLIINIYCFFSFFIGMVLGGYGNLNYFDKLVHTLSGTLFAFLGSLLFYRLKPVDGIEKHDYSLVSWFSVTFSLSVAVIWEIYEYILNFILGTDPQNVLSTGINDTMIDMIVCFIGALFLWFAFWLYYKKGKLCFVTDILIQFYNSNMKK